MLHAAVEIAPVFGGKLVSVDTAAAEKMPGVKRVIKLEEAVAVVADTYWQARKALATLKPQFDDAGHGAVTSATIFDAFDKALGAPPDMPAGATVVKADYRVPFLPHATMEPMACTVKVTGDRAEVWAGTQDPLNSRGTAAKALGISATDVQYTNLALGGGFGRKLPGYHDFVDMTARIAKVMSPAPVKLIWSRETDMQHGFYRPAAMARFAGALDAAGVPVAASCFYAGGGDGESTFMPYTIAEKTAKARDAKHHVRTGPWRSVLNSQHGFFKEAFIDEMAHAAKKDPFEFRRDLMTEHPRFKAVLEKVAAMAKWELPLPKGEGRGIAITESFGSIVGEVAHVAVSPDGTLKVKSIYAAVDCGDIVNIDTATAQVEGGIMFGLAAAWLGEITIADGKVAQSNFHDFKTLILSGAPLVQVQFIRSDAHIGGLGEPAVPPVAAAVTNAIFAATGVRVRDLPIKNAVVEARVVRWDMVVLLLLTLLQATPPATKPPTTTAQPPAAPAAPATQAPKPRPAGAATTTALLYITDGSGRLVEDVTVTRDWARRSRSEEPGERANARRRTARRHLSRALRAREVHHLRKGNRVARRDGAAGAVDHVEPGARGRGAAATARAGRGTRAGDAEAAAAGHARRPCRCPTTSRRTSSTARSRKRKT